MGGKVAVEKVFVDAGLFAANDEERETFHAEMDRLYRARTDPPTSRRTSLSRADVDRARRVALKLGSFCPVSSLSLADEIVRFHDLLAAVEFALSRGDSISALSIVRAEIDPSWGLPLDADGGIGDPVPSGSGHPTDPESVDDC